jgi:hypothetical protein
MRKPTTLEPYIYLDCQDFCFHDYPELARNYKINRPHFNKMFQRIDEIKVGGRVAYMNPKGIIFHFGLCTNRGTVISKMGEYGRIYEHSIENPGWGESLIKRRTIYSIPFRQGFNPDVRRFLNKA